MAPLADYVPQSVPGLPSLAGVVPQRISSLAEYVPPSVTKLAGVRPNKVKQD